MIHACSLRSFLESYLRYHFPYKCDMLYISGGAKEMAQLQISHKCYSGLRSPMKLHTSQLQDDVS